MPKACRRGRRGGAPPACCRATRALREQGTEPRRARAPDADLHPRRRRGRDEPRRPLARLEARSAHPRVRRRRRAQLPRRPRARRRAPGRVAGVLVRVQNELFDLGADLSVPWDVRRPAAGRAGPDRPVRGELRRFNAGLPRAQELRAARRREAAARLHVARAVCRRAERDVLAASQEVELNPLALVYLNRLSICSSSSPARRTRAATSRSGARRLAAYPTST